MQRQSSIEALKSVVSLAKLLSMHFLESAESSMKSWGVKTVDVERVERVEGGGLVTSMVVRRPGMGKGKGVAVVRVAAKRVDSRYFMVALCCVPGLVLR